MWQYINIECYDIATGLACSHIPSHLFSCQSAAQVKSGESKHIHLARSMHSKVGLTPWYLPLTKAPLTYPDILLKQIPQRQKKSYITFLFCTSPYCLIARELRLSMFWSNFSQTPSESRYIFIDPSSFWSFWAIMPILRTQQSRDVKNFKSRRLHGDK